MERLFLSTFFYSIAPKEKIDKFTICFQKKLEEIEYMNSIPCFVKYMKILNKITIDELLSRTS